MDAGQSQLAAGLDPLLLPLMLRHKALDEAAGIPFRLISTRRSTDHQAAEYAAYLERVRAWEANGRRGEPPRPAAKPGTSKHELGFAYDRTGPRTDAEWATSAAHAESLGLESGHRYNDRPHIELADPIDHLRTVLALRVAAVAVTVGALVASR